jgi:centrosomal protein CEP135
MAVWDERQHILLRRKLQALNYNDSLDVGSCDLVQNLVNDLVHTTESYRALKQQSDQQQQEIASFRSKVRTMLAGVRHMVPTCFIWNFQCYVSAD